MSRYIKINGIVEVQDSIKDDVFLDKYLDFVEANDWYFGGRVFEVPEEGEPAADKENLVLKLTKNETDFLMDVLEEAMLLPYGCEEDQEISERLYRMVKEND